MKNIPSTAFDIDLLHGTSFSILQFYLKSLGHGRIFLKLLYDRYIPKPSYPNENEAYKMTINCCPDNSLMSL